MSRWYRWLLVLLLATLLFPSAPSALAAPPASPAPTAAGFAPQFLDVAYADLQGRMGDAQAWTIGGGYLYWSNCFVPPRLAAATQGVTPAQASTYLRRWPLGGGKVVTLSNTGFCNTDLWAADATGLYYVLQEGANYNIYRRSTSDPTTAALVYSANTRIVSIALDGGFVYVLRDTILFGYGVYRVPNGGGSMGFIGSAGGNTVSNLLAAGSGFYWFADGQLMNMGRDCLGECIRALGAESGGQFLTDATFSSFTLSRRTHPMWVNGATIRGYRCSLFVGGGCTIGNSYTAPADASDPNNTYRYLPGKLSTDGTYLFWVEEHQRFSPGGGFIPPGYFATPQGRLMKWRLRSGLVGGQPDPFDTPQQIACQNCSGTYDMGASPTAVAHGWVYFSSSRGISRIRADAPPISWDIAVDGVEVTQAIQNLQNDVPLIANKSAFVRVYGRKLDGPAAMNVRALLYGADGNGNALPGSPLQPLNGAQNLLQNVAMNRGDAKSGWLFQLPSNWLAAGVKTLTPVLDPRNVYTDPNRQNNRREQRVTFSRKAPVCIVAVPVRTNAPAASHTDHGYQRQIDVLRKLFPVSDVWTYHQNEDVAELEARFGIPPWKYGPYELPDDGSKVLNALWLRDAFSDDPDKCDDADAETHYVGLVHAATLMGNNLGMGRIDSAVSYTKLVPADRWSQDDFREQRFNTLAHELGHNYEREHPRCGATEDIDTGYPYNPCMLDSRPLDAPSTYFGFEPRLQQPIAPNTAQDYMSYGAPYWTSDYTYKALFNRIASAAARQATAHEAALAAADAVVYLSGSVEHDAGTGSLDHAWVFPGGALSRGMRDKLQRFGASTIQARHADGAAHTYTIVLRDATGTELARKAFVPPASAIHDAPNSSQTFNLAIPAPAGTVARVELLDGTKLLASLQPGANAPTINIISPAGGEAFDARMTLSWRASDADPDDKLLYTVQYSPDNGRTWRAVLTTFANPGASDTISLELQNISGLPASLNSGQIRVAVSDGYNTTLATSKSFSVANRAPEVTISAPAPASSFVAGQSVLLQGSAMDAEDGSLNGDALRWSINGVALGSGQTSVAAGLAPGTHTATLTARDAAGKESSASVTFTVEALAVPQGNAPSLDGVCSDEAYAAAVSLPLKPYGDGSQASVQLIRSDTQLWACFSGLQRTGGTSSGSFASLRIDGNHTRDATPQADDVEYGFGEDGTVFVRRGTGGREAPVFGTVASNVSADDTVWNVEVTLEARALGGWNRVVGLMLDHNWVAAQGDDYHWPHASGWNKPNSWATTMLGTLPQLQSISPSSAAAGTPGLLLTVEGSNFAAGAQVLWNGKARATTVISATQLQARIEATDLANPGTASVTLANAESIGAPSRSLPFFVTPVAATAGGERRVLLPLISR